MPRFSPLSQGTSNSITALTRKFNQAITEVTSSVGQYNADGLFVVQAEATPTGAESRISLSVKASAQDTDPVQAAIFLDALATGKSRIVMAADQTTIADSSGNVLQTWGSDGSLNLDRITDLGLTSSKLEDYAATRCFYTDLTKVDLPANAGTASIPSLPQPGSFLVQITGGTDAYAPGETGLSGVDYGTYDKIVIVLGEYATTSGTTTYSSFWLQKSTDGTTWTDVPDSLVRYRQSVTPITQVFSTIAFIDKTYPYVRLLVNADSSNINLMSCKQVAIISKK